MERGFYASSVDAWLSGKRQPVKRVNGEILAKFRRSVHNVSVLRDDSYILGLGSLGESLLQGRLGG